MPLSNRARDYCEALWGDRLRDLIKHRDAELDERRQGLIDCADIHVRVGFFNYIQPELDHVANVGNGRMECLLKAYSLDEQMLSNQVIDEIISDAELNMKFVASALLKKEVNEELLAMARLGRPDRTGGYQMEEFERRLERVQSETKGGIERTLKIRMYEQLKTERDRLANAGHGLDIVVPDLDWCSEISLRKSVPTRCPFASVDLCPRCYLSLESLGAWKIATQLTPAEDARLEAKWKQHPLWPRTAEQFPAISGSNGRAKIFSHFCPEVAFDTFGLFADLLAEYTDELDRGLAHESLGCRSAARNDWRWQWASVSAVHYSDCPLYAPLLQKPPDQNATPESRSIIQFKPNWHGIGFDGPLLWKRVRAFFARSKDK